MGIVVLLPYYLVRILIYQPRKVCSGEGKGLKGQWLTPEEIEARRKIKKMCLYIAFPVIAVAIGVAAAILLNTM